MCLPGPEGPLVSRSRRPDGPVDEGFPPSAQNTSGRVGQRVVVVPLGGVDRNTRRLVDNQDILVLVITDRSRTGSTL